MSKITTGITATILLVSLLLIGITTASIISDGDSGFTEEENLEKIANEVIDEISTYIQIKDQKGKFYEIDGVKKIQKIAILISPLVTKDISVSKLTIQLDNGESVHLLTYSFHAEPLNQNSIFEHYIWNNISEKNFGLISICDLDDSLIKYDSINDCSDNAYIVFKLPSDMALAKYDKLIVTLFPYNGIKRVIELEAPLPIKSVITFE
jgi:archaellin